MKNNPRKTSPKPTLEYMKVDPALASLWLTKNVANRKVRPARVEQYARLMKTGNWNLSSDVISFDTKGNLQNGQHRLLAVIKSGRTVTLGVQRNAPVSAMEVIDNGAPRSTADLMRWRNEANPTLIAAAGRLAYLWETDLIYTEAKTQVLSPVEIIDFVEDFPMIRRSTEIVSKYRKRIDANPTPLVVAHWAIAESNGPDAADEFIRLLATRENLPEGSPILALDSRFREMRRNHNEFPNRDLLALIMKGWNYYANGTSVRTIAIQQRGTFRIPDPVIALHVA